MFFFYHIMITANDQRGTTNLLQIALMVYEVAQSKAVTVYTVFLSSFRSCFIF